MNVSGTWTTNQPSAVLTIRPVAVDGSAAKVRVLVERGRWKADLLPGTWDVSDGIISRVIDVGKAGQINWRDNE